MFFKKNGLKKKNYYQHKLLQKQLLYPYFQFNFSFFKTFFVCISIFNTNKKYVGIYKNYIGIYHVLPLIDSVKINDKINFYKNMIKFMYFMYVGSIMWLKYYGVFFLISNVGSYIPKIACSFGTYCIILKKKAKNTFKKCILPGKCP